MRKNEKRNGKALLPIVVFVVLYLGLGILFEYGLDIEMGFYKNPRCCNISGCITCCLYTEPRA